ncbi:hypothetical protein SOVF_047920 [Spinacia oleracea]|nr:hypothetical protein SOVF_047920 [Spinacia oleracea]
MITKTQNYECCMCGDHGLSYELFRCKVCHFRSQHRYCSNLYPKAESYRVCNWCLIQKDNDNYHQQEITPTSTTTTTSNNSNSPSQTRPTKKFINNNNNNNNVFGPKIGNGAKNLKPISPIKKPDKIPETRSPSGRKRIINGGGPAHVEEKLRRTKSEEVSNNNNSSGSSRSSGGAAGGGGGGPAVIKHVFRNKVRRYKLLDEVSS